jgi:hypothetical protein
VFQLEQQNLRDLVYEQGWQPGWAGVLLIADQLAGALAHLHGLEVLHRWVGVGGAGGVEEAGLGPPPAAVLDHGAWWRCRRALPGAAAATAATTC